MINDDICRVPLSIVRADSDCDGYIQHFQSIKHIKKLPQVNFDS